MAHMREQKGSRKHKTWKEGRCRLGWGGRGGLLGLLGACVLLGLGMAPAQGATLAYIPHQGSNNMSVIDIATNTIIATVPVGVQPMGVAANLAGTRVYVTRSDGRLSVIDTATLTAIDSVLVGSNPFGVAVNLAGTRVYVTSQSSTSVSVIDTATNTVIATVPVGANPVAFGQFIAPVQPPPSLALALTGCTTCRAGDRLRVQARVTNPGISAVTLAVEIGVRLPDGTPINLLGKFLQVPLPTGLDTTVTVFDTTLPPGLPQGIWTFEGALLEPELGATLSRSARFFDAVP